MRPESPCRRHLFWLGTCLFLASGCTGQAGTSVPGCPPESLIGAVHAAAFYFENGPVERAHTALVAVLDRAAGVPEPKTRALLTALSRADAAIDRDAQRRASEEVRARLSEWSCMSNELHERLHASLPPVAGR